MPDPTCTDCKAKRHANMLMRETERRLDSASDDTGRDEALQWYLAAAQVQALVDLDNWFFMRDKPEPTRKYVRKFRHRTEDKLRA